MLANCIREERVSDYNDFKDLFGISNDLEGGISDHDDQLIKKDLAKIPNETWLVKYVEPVWDSKENRDKGIYIRNDYFILSLLSETKETK